MKATPVLSLFNCLIIIYIYIYYNNKNIILYSFGTIEISKQLNKSNDSNGYSVFSFV